MGATLKAGETIIHEVGEGRHVYLVPATGALEANGIRLDARDGAAVPGGTTLTLTAIEDSEVVLVDAA
jgi:redox-sensitive bicupin YhaK (pirin superfamily)